MLFSVVHDIGSLRASGLFGSGMLSEILCLCDLGATVVVRWVQALLAQDQKCGCEELSRRLAEAFNAGGFVQEEVCVVSVK